MSTNRLQPQSRSARVASLLRRALIVAAVTAGGCQAGIPDGDEYGDPGRPARTINTASDRAVAGDAGDASRGDASGRDGLTSDAAHQASDSGPAQARSDASAAGPGSSDGPGQSSKDGALIGGPAPDGGPARTACEKCVDRMCRSGTSPNVVGDLFAFCYVPDPRNPRKVGKGPRPDLLFTDACKAVVDCVQRTQCFHSAPDAGALPVDPQNCYCGNAMGVDCLASKPDGTPKADGLCRAEIEAASGTTDPNVLLPNLYDPKQTVVTDPPQSAIGVAMQLVACEMSFCGPPCLAANTCDSDPTEAPNFNGNPRCDSPACKTQGDCLPNEYCVAQAFCSEEPDGGAPAVDGSPAASDAAGAPDATTTGVDAQQAPPPDAAPDAVTAGGQPDGGAALGWVPTAACLKCEQDNRQLGQEAGGCVSNGGCEHLPEGADRDLCVRALECMRRTVCWRTSTLDCICGTAQGADCLMHANGQCLAELEAALKTTSATEAGLRIFAVDPGPHPEDLPVPKYPGVYAAFVADCDNQFCSQACMENGAGRPVPDAQPPDSASTGGGPTTMPDAAPPIAHDAASTMIPEAAPPVALDAAPTMTPDASPATVPDAATAGAPDVAATVCPDLDGNGQPDCGETLVANPGFNGAASWKQEFGASQAANSTDAGGSAGSGSLAVTNTTVDATSSAFSIAGADQCVALTGGASYGLFAQAFIAAGQGVGGATVGLRFFGSGDCSGATEGSFVAPMSFAVASWVTVKAVAAAPAGARSASVRLLVQKAYNLPPLTALFDNVLVKRQ